MTPLNSKKPLDDSKKIVENEPINEMNANEQSNESPATAKKSPRRLKLMRKVGVTFMLVLSMLMIPPIKTRAADPVTTTVTFIVLTAASWLIGDVLSSAKAALLAAASRPNPPEASASVTGAFWTTNFYSNTHKVDSWDDDNDEWTGNWTTKTETASQGDYKKTNPVGTNEDGTAMSDSYARFLLQPKAKYTTKSARIELFDSDGWWLDDVWVHGREDAFEERKKIALQREKLCHGDDIYWGHEFEIRTQTWNVGDFKMESIFPPTKWPQLAHPKADESDADEYEGRLYWEYQEINETGYTADGMDTWQAPVEDDYKFFDFWSYKYDVHSHSVCKDNQVLHDGNYDSPHISDGITRRFVVKPREEDRITKVFRRTGPFGFPMWDDRSYQTNSVVVGTKIDVEQYEPVYQKDSN